ncbi:MAG: ABC transporter substrate-binding protein [Oscillospiraceae bacterium]
MLKRIIALTLTFALLFSGCGTAGKDAAKQPAAENKAQTEVKPETKTDGQTITITDHAGKQVTLPSEINRIVVADVYPMASVISVFLGSAEKLVGIHPVCMSAAKSGLLGELYPEILNANTDFMTGPDVNIEELLALKPDVVFYIATNTALATKLENAGIAAVGISTSKWNYDVMETYDNWVSLLGEIFPANNKTQEISDYSKQIYSDIQTKTADIKDADKKKILFLFQYDDTQIVTSGKNFFGQFWCEAVGGVNVAEGVEAMGSNAVISMEQIYEWNPDVIFITNFTPTLPEQLYSNAIGGDDWSSINAVKNKTVYKLPLGIYRSYTPSADTPVTLLWMAQKVYPELFADVKITDEVKKYYKEIYNVDLTDAQIERMYNPSASAANGYK